MDYPLMLKGEAFGLLSVEKQGLYTVMEARTPEAEGLVRLWVQGEGKEAYLGVMQPCEGGLCLKRRLSRMEMAAFPGKIERASDCQLKDVVYITKEAEPSAGEAAEKNTDMGEGVEDEKMEETEDAEENREPGKKARAGQGGNRDGPGTNYPPGFSPAAGRAGENMSCGLKNVELETWQPTAGELIWRERRDGSLAARSGEGLLVALPAKLRSVPPGARLRRIGGREYLVFRY